MTRSASDEPTLENTFVATLRSHRAGGASERLFRGSIRIGVCKGEVAIGATKLTKRFGSFTAVKDVNLQVQYGEIYGLLGANGAGKTTTIKMLCGLLEPTSGEMELAGDRGNLRSEDVRQRIGYMSQKFSLYDDLTIGENLDFFAGVYGVPDDEREEKKRWVMAFSGLEGKQDQITGSLPGGWKQRVAFGAAIMHEPSVLFLDEPTSGVDPLARRAFWRMINRLADMGTAILVTTHYLEEAEQCNRLGFMVAGELVAEGTPSGVKSEQGGHLIEFVVDQPQKAADLAEEDDGALAGFAVRRPSARHYRWRRGDGDQRHHRRNCCGGRHSPVLSARRTYSLEDVFIGVVEKARSAGQVCRRKSSDETHSCPSPQGTDANSARQAGVDAGAGSAAHSAVPAGYGDFADGDGPADRRAGPRRFGGFARFCRCVSRIGDVSRGCRGRAISNRKRRSRTNAARGALIIPRALRTRYGARLERERAAAGGCDGRQHRQVNAGLCGRDRTRAYAARNAGRHSLQPVHAEIRLWFNPGRDSKKFYGPGIFVLGISMFPPLLAALAMSQRRRAENHPAGLCFEHFGA